MKRYLNPAFVALGIATLCLLAILGPLISPSHTVVYHTRAAAFPLFVAVLFDLLVLWALLTLALVFAETSSRRQVFVWSAIVLALPLVLLKNASMLAGFLLPHRLSMSIVALSLTAFLALQIFWKPSFLPAFQRTRRFLTVVFAFAALNGILIVAQLLWYGGQVHKPLVSAALHQPSVASTQHASGPRVIWILLDELSYQQIYERRFPGLELPAFDAIARQSTVFTHVVPAGAYTEEILPALMTGMPVDNIRSSSNGQRLTLHNPATKQWLRFDPSQTVFEDALHAGYRTALAGWYNPYCRILSPVLDRCFWTSQFPYPGGIVAGQSLAKNVQHQLIYGIGALSSLLPGRDTVSLTPALESRLHIADYSGLRRAGDSMLADSTADFLFLHMPLPHPGGIYNRRNRVLTTGQSSYIDNLALADSYLAHVRNLLQQRGEWDADTIVIMGDHSWRTSFVWSKMDGWTPEDEAASHGGQFDDRPGYIVKLPHQQQAARIDAPFKALHTRALLDALIAGQLHTTEDLAAWTKQQ